MQHELAPLARRLELEGDGPFHRGRAGRISDFAGAGLVDDAVFAMTRPDGTADPDALDRYLLEHPERIAVLTQLAQDMTVATEAAAKSAIRTCQDL